MSRSVRVDNHQVSVQGDVLFCTAEGDFTLKSAAESLKLAEEVLQRHGAFFLLMDAAKMGSVTPDARRYTAQWFRQNSMAGIACYGASMPVRALVTLIARAVLLIRKDAVRIAFVKDEKDGRDWIDAQRPKLPSRSRPG